MQEVGGVLVPMCLFVCGCMALCGWCFDLYDEVSRVLVFMCLDVHVGMVVRGRMSL